MESTSILQGISSSVFGQGVATGNVAEPPEVLVESFQQALQGMSPSEMQDLSQLDGVELIKPTATSDSDGSFFGRLQQGIAGVDNDFKQTMNRVENWPSFSSYLERFDTTLHDSVNSSERGDIRHISNVDDVSNDRVDFSTSQDLPDSAAYRQKQVAERYAEMQVKTQMHYQAGAQYNTESTMWFLRAEFWMTKVKVLTSAVSSASQGVKTLFTS